MASLAGKSRDPATRLAGGHGHPVPRTRHRQYGLISIDLPGMDVSRWRRAPAGKRLPMGRRDDRSHISFLRGLPPSAGLFEAA
jgi:hypothetical protein